MKASGEQDLRIRGRMKTKLLQEFFLSGLDGVGLPSPERVRIDHRRVRQYCEKTGWVPLVFPLRIVIWVFQFSLRIRQREDHFLQGTISSGRAWMHGVDDGRKLKAKASKKTRIRQWSTQVTSRANKQRLCGKRVTLFARRRQQHLGGNCGSV